ncbi:MAG: tail fiber protein [Tardiphaga sp.]
MSDPFIGEIRLFGFPRIPDGWLGCNGALYSIAEYEVLYTLIGTVYGGDGNTTFGVPDLRGRVPLAQGSGRGLTPRALGEIGGQPQHTLLTTEMPTHSHALVASMTAGETAAPGPSVQFATASLATAALYTQPADIPSYVVMANSIALAGQNQAHDNMMPTLTANYCICYAGIFPSQS